MYYCFRNGVKSSTHAGDCSRIIFLFKIAGHWINSMVISHFYEVKVESLFEEKYKTKCRNFLSMYESFQGFRSFITHSFPSDLIRISEEVMEMKQELIDLQKHVSSQGILVQDLINGVCHEIEEWNKRSPDPDPGEDIKACGLEDLFSPEKQDARAIFFENIDVLLAEHKTEEALQALEVEEKRSTQADESGEHVSTIDSSYKGELLKRKAMLVEQLVGISEQPTVGNDEMKKVLLGLVKLGKGPLGHKLFLKKYGSRLQKSIEAFLPSCSIYAETYTATLSQLVFSTISHVKRESCNIFGDSPTYTSKTVQWAEYEIESFVRIVKENGPLSDSTSALRSVSICMEATFHHCSLLESQGLKFSKLVMVLLRPYVEEVLDMNFRRARRRILDFSGIDDTVLLVSSVGSPFPEVSESGILLANNGKKFISIVVVSCFITR